MSKGVSSKHMQSYAFFNCMTIKIEHCALNAGLHFIESYFSSAVDGKLHSPIGFDIIFPGMVGYAIEMGLDLHIGQDDLDAMFYMRDLELQRYGISLIICI